MKFIDLTHTINNNMTEFPEDPKTSLKQIETPECNLFEYSTSLHTGTHMDAPFHYFEDKKINDYNLDDFIGHVKVINCNDKIINCTDSLDEIIIINTGKCKDFGTDNYFVDYPYLSIEFAQRLIEKNVKGIAIDTCSVDKPGENKIHKLLLKNNIWVVENLNSYNKLKNEKYKGYFIPLKIEAEASQIRAFVEEI